MLCYAKIILWMELGAETDVLGFVYTPLHSTNIRNSCSDGFKLNSERKPNRSKLSLSHSCFIELFPGLFAGQWHFVSSSNKGFMSECELMGACDAWRLSQRDILKRGASGTLTTFRPSEQLRIVQMDFILIAYSFKIQAVELFENVCLLSY